jgi:hypothetical protein
MHACEYYERTVARVLRYRIHSVRTCAVVYKRMFARTRVYVCACSASVKCAHVRGRASMLARVYTCMSAFVHARMLRVHASVVRRRVRVCARAHNRIYGRSDIVRMSPSACMNACVNACVNTCMNASVNTCAHECVREGLDECVHAFSLEYIQTRLSVHVRTVRMRVHASMHACM